MEQQSKGWGRVPPRSWIVVSECFNGMDRLGQLGAKFTHGYYHNPAEKIRDYHSVVLDLGLSTHHGILHRFNALRLAYVATRSRRNGGS